MLYTDATIITVDLARQIIEDGAIFVYRSTIADIGKTDCLLARYTLERQYSLNGCIVFPGLISTHVHTVQAILRGTAEGLHKET